MPLEAADKTMICSAGQASIIHVDLLEIHLWVYIEESGRLTLGAK